jgi:hypothetical protein
MKQARAVRTLLPALFYLAWAIFFTYPLVLHVSSGVVLSSGGDAWLHLWDLWWADKSLVDLHQNPYYTTYLYYPTGVSLTYHSLDILNGVVSIPLQHLFGLTASFNLLLIANLTLDGLATYWLCLELSGSSAAAFVGGALFSAAPLMGTSVNLGQLDEVTAWWMPLFVLALWRALRSPGPFWRPGGGRWAVLGAGLCLAGASLATWYFTAGLVVFTIVFEPAYVLSQRDEHSSSHSLLARWGDSIAKSAAAMGVFAVLLSPLLLAMIGERLSGATYMLPSYQTTLANSADLLGLILPGRTEVAQINAHGSNVALGLVALALALIGLIRRWRLLWPLGLALVAIVTMSLGPHLQVGGNDTQFPMPYALLNNVPFIGASRQPLRFLATAAMCVSLLASFGVAGLVGLARQRLAKWSIVGVVMLLVAVELLGIPRAITSTAIGPAYNFVAASPESGAVMELPYELWQGKPQYYQSLHERPVLGGYTSRHFPYPFIESAPGVSQLAAGFPETLSAVDIVSPSVALTARASLDYYGVRYIVVHRADLATGRFGRLESLLAELFPGGPAYQDSDTGVYITPHGDIADIALDSLPLVGLGRGWHEVEENPTKRWTGSDPGNGDAFVWLGIRPAATGHYTLTLDTFAYGAPKHLTVVLNGKALQRFEIGLAPQTVVVDLGVLSAGDYSLVLQVDEPATSPPGDRRLLSLGVTRLQVDRRSP